MGDLATRCHAGHCTACDRPVWRLAAAARQNGAIAPGQVFILWPQPDSVYARLLTDTGHAPGVAFCAEHAPELGSFVLAGFGYVVGLDAAHARYAAWFSPEHGVFRRAWLRDALSLEPPQVDSLMQQWERDRALRG